jgi:2-phosphoglycerate kinase
VSKSRSEAEQRTIYFIGGAPRTGKSTVALKFISKNPIVAASTDSIRAVAKNLLNSEVNPELHRVGRGSLSFEEEFKKILANPQKNLESQIKESQQVWKSVLKFIFSQFEYGQDMLIEGVAILPEEIAKLKLNSKLNIKAIFLIGDENNTEEIIKHATQNPHDWLHKYNKNQLTAFCELNQYSHNYYKSEAQKYGFKVIKIDSKKFKESAEDASKELLK